MTDRAKYCKLYLMKDITKLARAIYLPPRDELPLARLRNACIYLGVDARGTEAQLIDKMLTDLVAAKAKYKRKLTFSKPASSTGFAHS